MSQQPNKHESKTQPKQGGKHDHVKQVSPAQSAQNKPFNDAAATDAKKHLNDGDGVGEGNRAAARRYDEGVAKSEARGNSDALAEKAKKALDGPEGDELRRAEEEGKKAHTPKKHS